ncbi:hypothetical protein P691DRAFT_623619, partial [Macrolepiota fuliginosa MF-IS2]
MTLDNGFYTFCYFGEREDVNTRVGGVYASSRNGKKRPVTAESLGPVSGLKIRWWVAKVADKDLYTVTEVRDDECIPGQWTRSCTQTDVPVFLFDHVRPYKDSTSEWGIHEVDQGVYHIMGNSRSGGADWLDLRYE